jgi:hypothetical protein
MVLLETYSIVKERRAIADANCLERDIFLFQPGGAERD